MGWCCVALLHLVFTLERDEDGNCTLVEEFILLGFSESPEQDPPLFTIFLTIYTITLIGNLGMIILIRISAQLHTPMYFFLCNLSMADICYSSVITPPIAPKMLVDFYAETKKISYSGCIMQLFVFALFANVECLLLTLMAYDRYVAICNPLLYSIIMSKRTCQELMTVVYFIGLVSAMINTSCTFQLSFCRSNIINHFFCDVPPLLILSCSDTYISEIVIFAFGCIEGISIGMVLVSYAYILSTVLRMHSAEGRYKAFSTCASHLTAVGIYHGTILFMYFRPSSSYSMDQDKWTSLFYTVVIPMLNPLIYIHEIQQSII
uniref:Olfactory receptor n=1 Tax=Naja naja TaxID=35670 RepID=A0A8C6Y4Z9_NAJNA